MEPNPYVAAVRGLKDCFDRTTDCLHEEDSGFAPREGMLTVAQQVAHVAQTIEWFLEGAFSERGFDLDFEKHERRIREVTSLAEARSWLGRAVSAAVERLGAVEPAEMEKPIAEGPILGGAPRSAIVAAMTDHTAHHRGALAVYARLRGKTPAMPYA